MRTSVFATLAIGTMLVSQPAWGQAAAPAPSVDSYLCAFAGKCGDAQAADSAQVTRDAPPTRGFSLARPQTAKPTEPAPATRGFRMAQPTRAKTVPAASAPAQRNPATAPRRAPAAVAAATAARPSAGSALPGRRADLMIAFEMNSDRMTSLGEARARVFADSILRPELLGKRFVIEGHTDSVGNRASNLDLSRRRAKAVADYLTAAGVDKSRIETRGHGFGNPLPGRKASDPANRRVEAELIS
ncbi:OmpA family protein [Sphingomonas sp.]|uniref:OmpA family protein n=1 Tax=Sphingomonas sp. TaxID=28214 RepID=UPI002DD6906C|nr:OmpA family protein [Sphingomonas sp.]